VPSLALCGIVTAQRIALLDLCFGCEMSRCAGKSGKHLKNFIYGRPPLFRCAQRWQNDQEENTVGDHMSGQLCWRKKFERAVETCRNAQETTHEAGAVATLVIRPGSNCRVRQRLYLRSRRLRVERSSCTRPHNCATRRRTSCPARRRGDRTFSWRTPMAV
jgi:hypothetical protein